MLKNFLIKIWESWGIERDDKILLHSSFKRTFKNIKDNGYNSDTKTKFSNSNSNLLSKNINKVDPENKNVILKNTLDLTQNSEENKI